MVDQGQGAGPLAGIRVLELGQLLAGPWAGTQLAYFGADVIKVEAPSGDPIRGWRQVDEGGTSYWWRSLARNKRCITLNLRDPRGQTLARSLAEQSDVLIENFRPGTLERWGLGPDVLHALHPGLVIVRVSGFGQTGPYRDRPGYASIAEAMGGLRHLTGEPDAPPVRPNLSLGDTLAGMQAAMGVLLALRERDRSGRGQVIDVALTEAVFGMLEAVVPERAGAGVTRAPSGTTITGVAPSNLYRCQDGHVVIGANGESLFRRFVTAIGRPDLAEDPRMASNAARVSHSVELDRAIEDWTKARTVLAVVDALVAAEVPCGPVYDAQAMRSDPHFEARGWFEQVDGFELPAIGPRLSRTPGQTRHAGPALGTDTDAVLASLGCASAEVEALRRDGVI
ncbi:MAG: CaiB/BaiF CoA transferase family protein [Sandaracinaceae bacterium]